MVKEFEVIKKIHHTPLYILNNMNIFSEIFVSLVVIFLISPPGVKHFEIIGLLLPP